MSTASDVEVQSTELLRTLIRNACVNTGEESSGHEDRSCDALETFFQGSGLSCERYTSSPGRMRWTRFSEDATRSAAAGPISPACGPEPSASRGVVEDNTECVALTRADLADTVA